MGLNFILLLGLDTNNGACCEQNVTISVASNKISLDAWWVAAQYSHVLPGSVRWVSKQSSGDENCLSALPMRARPKTHRPVLRGLPLPLTPTLALTNPNPAPQP